MTTSFREQHRKSPLDAAFNWRDMLGLLQDVADVETLTPFCQRIDALIGARTRPRQWGEGEPDGVDGLTHRGSYDRLLMSEWGIAEVEPLEFIRRAGSDEHMFFSLARQTQEGARHTLVYFDAGPTQLGAPRLCHLAILLVLRARANKSGARLHWKTLQARNGLNASVDEQALSRLLRERSSQIVCAADLAQAMDDEEKVGIDDDIERWWVGSSALQSMVQEFTPTPDASACFQQDPAIEVLESIDLDHSRLLLSLQEAGRSATTIVLPRPDAAVCTRLLRDPFARRSAPPMSTTLRIDPDGGLVFSSNGRRLLVKTRGGNVVAFSVPNSPAQKPGKPKEVRNDVDGGRVIAAGITKRRPFFVASTDGEFRIKGLERYTGTHFFAAPAPPIAPPEDTKIGLAGVRFQGPSQEPSLVFVDDGARLIEIPLEYGLYDEQQCILHPGPVLALSLHQAVVVFAVDNKSQNRMEIFQHTGDQSATMAHSISYERLKAKVRVTMGGTGVSSSWQGLISVFDGSLIGTFFGAPKSTSAAFDSRNAIAGIFPSSWAGPVGVVLDAERNRFLSHDGSGVIASSRTPAEVLHHAVSPTAAAIAYLTVDGDIGVFSFDHQALLLDVRDVDQM